MHHSKSRPDLAPESLKKAVWVLGLSIALGCAGAEGAPSESTTSHDQAGAESTTEAHTEPLAEPAPEPAANAEWEYPTQACRDLLARYLERLASASGTCAADADCARYGGVDPADVCGGVTDASAAQSLRAIRVEMDTAQCPALPYSCPALDPVCHEGRCAGGYE